MANQVDQKNQKTSDAKQVRGQELNSQAQESQEFGEDYRASHQGQDTIKPVKPNQDVK
jgi:hypothetical protein